MRSVPLLLLFIFLPGFMPLYADVPAQNEADFVSPAVSSDVVPVAMQQENARFAGNPLKNMLSGWPEDLVIAPVPGYSSQLGWNLTLAGGYFLNGQQKETGSPPSTIGGFVMGSENNSQAYGAGAKLHLLDDRLRVQLGATKFNIKYFLYGSGNPQDPSGKGIGIRHEGPVYFLSASWRLWRDLFLGLGYISGEVKTGLQSGRPVEGSFDPAVNVNLGAFSIPLEIDSRDHEQFPREGWLVTAKATLHNESFGSDFDGNIVNFTANHYYPIGDRDVLATRLAIRKADNDLPFFLLSTFGGKQDLRGYPAGRYRAASMYALQTEYRWQFSERWIFTGFAGFGEVAEKFSDFGDRLLPAIGVGARFVLSAKHKVSLSADIARGQDGTEYYFGVGQAF